MILETYIRYLEEQMGDIEAGKPVTIQVTDREIFEQKVVKAIIAKSPDKLPEGENLWIKNEREEIGAVPWRIKVIEETGDLFIRPPEGLTI
jgi:hypothetical protein